MILANVSFTVSIFFAKLFNTCFSLNPPKRDFHTQAPTSHTLVFNHFHTFAISSTKAGFKSSILSIFAKIFI